MKKTELRIGNLINESNEVLRIGRWLLISSDKEIGWDVLKDEDIKPIPLTKEWLVKFGFEKHKTHSHWLKEGFVIDLVSLKNNKGYYLCDIDLLVKIEYVHQLQNLYFAITGEELTS